MFSMIKPDDFHVHLRQGDIISSYIKDYENYIQKILVMPNTTPPIDTPKKVTDYKRQILKVSSHITPLMSFKLNPSICPSSIVSMKKAGAVSGKLYPVGVTTNSEDGVQKVEDIYPLLSIMEEEEIYLCIHAESPLSFCLQREADFLNEIKKILENFPRLHVVIEHLSDYRSVDFILEQSKKYSIAGTITVHHLLFTLDDVIGGYLKPHHFCKPILKQPVDRKRLLEAAFSSHPSFFFGSDSAPHNQNKKECECGAAGVYSAPTAIPILIELFEAHHNLNLLENFTSKFGSNFYQLPINKEKINFEKKDWTVASHYSKATPLYANKTLKWSLKTSSL